MLVRKYNIQRHTSYRIPIFVILLATAIVFTSVTCVRSCNGNYVLSSPLQCLLTASLAWEGYLSWVIICPGRFAGEPYSDGSGQTLLLPLPVPSPMIYEYFMRKTPQFPPDIPKHLAGKALWHCAAIMSRIGCCVYHGYSQGIIRGYSLCCTGFISCIYHVYHVFIYTF